MLGRSSSTCYEGNSQSSSTANRRRLLKVTRSISIPATRIDKASFRQLLTLLPTLRAFAIHLSRSRDLADDLVQETVTRAWTKQASFELATNLRAWLFTILRNEFYSQMRKRGREVEDRDGAFAASVAVPPSQEAAMDLADVGRALGGLPGSLREAIILVGASGLSYEEAARICKCAVGTIKSRVSRARARLRAVLEVIGDCDPAVDTASNIVHRSYSNTSRPGALPSNGGPRQVRFEVK
jgi:RNA polymerase sigma-70 factor, ECF subfamily